MSHQAYRHQPWSLPLWERGLKSLFAMMPQYTFSRSLPLWERGLKWRQLSAVLSDRIVAPLVGAWIEISTTLLYTSSGLVAPLVGAWIEIDNQGRPFSCNRVAPLVGAWIEMPIWSVGIFKAPSLPLWERGLKSDFSEAELSLQSSLPLWERGLK